MLKMNLLISFRFLNKNKLFSGISIAGLALGLATFFIILSFTIYHWSFDQYNEDSDRIIRIGMIAKLGDDDVKVPALGGPAAELLQKEVPAIENATKIGTWMQSSYNLKVAGKNFLEEDIYYSDNQFFNIFSIPLIVGNKNKMLSEPNSLVLTRALAAKYFGESWESQEIIGQQIELEGLPTFKISGICEDVPSNTHFNFNMLLSFESIDKSSRQFWLAESYHTYLKLKNENTVEDLEALYPSLIEKFIAPEIQMFMGISLTQFEESGNNFEFFTQKLTDIHLYSHLENELGSNMNASFIIGLFIISLLILFIACINFINLTIATSMGRIKEIGIRKVLGSRKIQMINQFNSESILMVFLSVIIALTIIQFIEPFVENYFQIDLGIHQFRTVWLLPIGLAFSIILGVMAGFYPAMLMTSGGPISHLKSNAKKEGKSWIRNVLLVFQFGVSIGLITCVMIMQKQVTYLQTKELGYNKEQVYTVFNMMNLGESRSTFKAEVEKLNGVSLASLSNFSPADYSVRSTYGYQISTEEDVVNTYRIESSSIDENTLDVLGMKLLNGRNFNPNMGNENSNIIINEQACRFFGWDPESSEPLGQSIFQISDKINFKVVGVVKDFHFTDMNLAIEPFIFNYTDNGIFLSMKIDAVNNQAIVQNVNNLWGQMTPENYVDRYLETSFMKKFKNEGKQKHLFSIFSALALIIAFMGLFGMSAHSIYKRAKEISIRKILGASLKELFELLSYNFMIIILVSVFIVFPFVFWSMNLWLDNYAYRIELPYWIIIIPFLLVAFMALIIVGIHILRVSRINPVEMIRDE